MINTVAGLLAIDPMTLGIAFACCWCGTYMLREALGEPMMAFVIFPMLMIGSLLGNYAFQLLGITIPFDPDTMTSSVDAFLGNEESRFDVDTAIWSTVATLIGMCSGMAAMFGLLGATERLK